MPGNKKYVYSSYIYILTDLKLFMIDTLSGGKMYW